MRYLTIEEVLELHRLVITQSGGGSGVRDPNALDSALAQPRMTFGGVNLYPTAVEKAAALGFALVMNHPFVDGNKRIGHAAGRRSWCSTGTRSSPPRTNRNGLCSTWRQAASGDDLPSGCVLIFPSDRPPDH